MERDACLLAVVAFLFLGCAEHARPTGKSSRAGIPAPARSVVQRGPISLLAEVTPRKARLSDELTLTLQIATAEGVRVEHPELKETIGDFMIRGVRKLLPRVEENREVFEQIYTLEPTRTGELIIPPIPVKFTVARQDGEAEFTVETEKLAVEIETVVASDSPSLADLRPLAAPVEVPAERGLSPWWIIAPLAICLAAAAWLARRRGRRTVKEKTLSPQELAELELQQLLSRELAETDVKLFYTELTAVVRRYIERTTAVRAPEQTTEEFLREIAEKGTFPTDESQRLKQFLESADLVKFAAHQPRDEDIHESILRARRFLGLHPAEVAV